MMGAGESMLVTNRTPDLRVGRVLNSLRTQSSGESGLGIRHDDMLCTYGVKFIYFNPRSVGKKSSLEATA
jgi:hypothetical protein